MKATHYYYKINMHTRTMHNFLSLIRRVNCMGVLGCVYKEEPPVIVSETSSQRTINGRRWCVREALRGRNMTKQNARTPRRCGENKLIQSKWLRWMNKTLSDDAALNIYTKPVAQYARKSHSACKQTYFLNANIFITLYDVSLVNKRWEL
jgi:hypothetical protein